MVPAESGISLSKVLRMETRANYVLVGGFVLAGFLTIIIFLVWLSKINFGESYQLYDIYFQGTVTGLKKGATVQYRGVPIGTVKDIAIRPTDVEMIRVRISVERKVKLREGVYASLEMQGITGISFVQITGGTSNKPILKAPPGKKYPVIPAKTSLLEEVAGSVPEILAMTTHLIKQIQDVLSDENREALKKTIQNIEDITNYLTPTGKKEGLLDSMRKSIQSIDVTMQELRQMIAENRTNFKNFSTNGFDSLTKFLNEGRDAMTAIKRVSEALERSPSRFFYNDPKQGVRAR